MKNFGLTTALILTLFFVSGCATATRGTTQSFEILSEPGNADVRMSNGLTCKTPCKLVLPRKESFSLTASMNEFDPVTINIESKFAAEGGAMVAGNLLIGGLIGAAVDAGSGATLDLIPNPVYLVFTDDGGEKSSAIVDKITFAQIDLQRRRDSIAPYVADPSANQRTVQLLPSNGSYLEDRLDDELKKTDLFPKPGESARYMITAFATNEIQEKVSSDVRAKLSVSYLITDRQTGNEKSLRISSVESIHPYSQGLKTKEAKAFTRDLAVKENVRVFIEKLPSELDG